MKKLKLVMSIATMCLAIAVLCFGVLAATSVTYTIQGTISYDVEDVYVDVNTTVYKSEKYLSATEQSRLVDTLGDPANLSSAKTTYELVETGVNNSFSTLNTESPTPFDGLELTFNKDVKTYVIVVNVKNLTANNAWAVVDSRTSTSTNVTIVDNYQLEISKTADTNGKNVVIVVTPTDVTQPIDSGTFTFNLVFGSNEYVNSITNMSKMTIAEDKSVKKASDDISGVLVIPSSVTSIGNSAFGSCDSLTSIEIPSSVTSIGNSAFNGCRSLTSINIPEGVTSIGYNIFNVCTSLKTVYITDLAKWCSISFGNSASNPLSNGANLYLNGTLVTDLVIPSSVTSIGNYAFSGCSSLTSVTFEEGSSVTSIGNSAFSGCSSLTSITIPSSVTSIGIQAFAVCSGLESITVSGTGGTYTAQNNCLIKGSELVLGCKNSIIPTDGSVTSIGSDAFYLCRSLTSITIPSSVTSIGNRAFGSCDSLTSIEIPSSVTSIDNTAFNGCSGLESITVSGTGGTYTAQNNCLIKDKELVLGCKNSIIPTDDSVTSIGINAFRNCSILTRITIPSSVTSIGSQVFFGCSSLTSITIPSSVTSIGGHAFYGCSSLNSVTFEYKTWKAGSKSLDLTSTSTSTNATYLRSTYLGSTWTKS